jgi:hypothetical protein
MFFLLLNVLVVSLVTGIIIDAFSEMRQEEEYVINTCTSRCLVCDESRDKFILGTKSLGSQDPIRNHIIVDHCLWNYMYVKKVIMDKYMNEADRQEMTGLESHMYETITKSSRGFVSLLPRTNHKHE